MKKLLSTILSAMLVVSMTVASASALTFVEIKGKFIDVYGRIIDTDWTYAVGSEGLAPGESTTFRLSVEKNREILDAGVSALSSIVNNCERKATTPRSGLISFYKLIYLQTEIMVATRMPKAIIKDNASYVVIANTSQTGGTDSSKISLKKL